MKRNYRFEKHQKDLAKRRKKEEKLLRKQERAAQPDEGADGQTPADSPEVEEGIKPD